MKPFNRSSLIAVLTLIILFVTLEQSKACTRVVYQGPNKTILTARSMDWQTEIPANLWVLPRGMERNGEVGTGSVKWKAKYGSVGTSSWDIGSSGGMNEKGLVGNLIWLVESSYTPFGKDGEKKGI